MASLREAQVGKVSLSDEITMLERLKASLISVREQARFIAASTGDERTKEALGKVGEHTGGDRAILVYLIARAKEQQREKDEETARDELAALSKELGRE